MPLALDIGPLFGPLVIGYTFGTALYGCSVVQCYIFYTTAPDRSILNNIMVILSLALDTVSLILQTQSLYLFLLTNFGNPLIFFTIPKVFIGDTTVLGVGALMTQLFFAWKIYHLLRASKAIKSYGIFWSSAIPIAILIPALASFVCVIIATHQEVQNPLISLYTQGGPKATFIVQLVTAAVSDILITVCLCTILDSFKNSFKSTNQVLGSLVALVLGRGVLVCAVTLCCLFVFVSNPAGIIWVAFRGNLLRVYTNTLLAFLNGRPRKQSLIESDYATQPSMQFSSRPTRTFGQSSTSRGETLGAGEDVYVLSSMKHSEERLSKQESHV